MSEQKADAILHGRITELYRHLLGANFKDDWVILQKDGEVRCPSWGPLLAVRDAGIVLHERGSTYYLNPEDIPRAAAVLRLQGFEVTIDAE